MTRINLTTGELQAIVEISRPLDRAVSKLLRIKDSKQWTLEKLQTVLEDIDTAHARTNLAIDELASQSEPKHLTVVR